MRTHNSAFASLNTETVREPRFVIEFDFGGEDYHYFTSHPVDGLAGTNVTDGVLTRVDSTSQKLDPDKANSKIGSMTVRIADEGLTELQQAKLNDDKGLRNKRVRYYAGFAELSWSSFTLVQTQLIQGASYKEQEYTFKCADIQRQMRDDIFALKETTLSASLTADATEIQVYSVNGLNLVQQPVSPTGRTLASGKKICLVRIEGDNDAFEIAMAEEIDESTNTLKQVTRGVLGTNPLEIEVDPDEKRDNAPKVTEYVYLDMPAPMLAYALLTGSIYGYPGEYLPDHWHMGVGPEFIRTSEYQNIGADLWDLNDFDAGLSVVLAGVEKESGKKFVEEQVFRLMGCYPPIYSDGQIGLRRMTLIPSQSGYSRVLNEGNVLKAATLEHDMGGMINDILVFWNWNQRKEAFTRVNRLLDSGSIKRNGQSETLEIEFRGLTAERHTYTTIKNILDSLRDRYAGPPLRTSLELSPENNDLEVGDIVRVNLAGVKDYSTDQVDVTLNRNFEVQQVKVDWQTGKVTVDLFGSSQRASELPVDEFGSALPLSWYQSEGTEISAANFPGAVLEEAGGRRITSNITLDGHASISDAAAIYWCPEDLTIDGGVVVTITENVQIRAAGYFQNNGKIDGRGNGQPGGQGLDQITTDPTYSIRYAKWENENRGLPGYLRAESMPQPDSNIFKRIGLIWIYSSGYYRFESGGQSVELEGSYPELEPVGGQVVSAARAGLEVSDGSLRGLPAFLWGSSGHGGGFVAKTPTFQDLTFLGPGSSGGNSGAGLAIICRGFAFGDNGIIDLSGGDAGTHSQFYQADSWARAYPGTGAPGGPGALYFVIDGETSIPGDITEANFHAFYGEAEVPGFQGTRGSVGSDFTFIEQVPNVYVYSQSGGNEILSPLRSPQPTSLNVWQSAYVVHQLTGSIPVTPDIPEDTVNPVSVTIAELTNTPRSANANLSTIEVSVQPPSVSSYKYALVEYREKGQQGWFEVGPASPEVGFVVPSDGKTYEIRARGVSLSGNVVPDSPIHEITTTKVLNAEPGDEDVDDVVPAPNVHGLELFEQGNDAVFGGRDAKFVWRKTSVTEWLEMGSEGQLGASRGSLDLYFKDYQVEVWADGSLVRTEWVVDPAFVYTYEKNAEDYAREQGQAGAWRAFEVRVYCRGRQGQISPKVAALPVSNPAPVTPVPSLTPSLRTVAVNFQQPQDLDYTQTAIWISTVQGFTPDASTFVGHTADATVISGLEDNTTYYLRVRAEDSFGPGSMSDELSVTTQQLTVSDLPDIGAELDQIESDLAQNTANITANADELSDHSTELLQHSNDLAQHTQDIADNVTAIGQLETRVTDTENGISTNSSAIIGLDSRVTENEGDITSNASAITQLETDLASTDGDVSANTSAIQTLDTRVTSAEGTITTHTSEITALQTSVADAENDISANVTAIDSLDTRVTSAEGTISAHSADITTLQTDVSDAQSDADANATAIDSLDTRVTSAEGTISSHSTQLTSLDNRVTTNEGDISGNATAITGLDSRVTVNEGDISVQSGQLTQLESDVTSLQTDTAANATAIDSIDTRVTSTEEELQVQATDITVLYASAAEADTLVFRQSTEPTVEDLEPLGEGVPTLDLNFIQQSYRVVGIPDGSIWFHTGEGNKTYVYEGGAWVDTQDQLTLTNATAIQTLDTRVTDTEDETTANATAITQLQTDVTDAENDISANANAVTSLDTRVTTNEGDISSQASQITTLDTQVGDNSASITQQASSIDGLEARYTLDLDVNGVILGVSAVADPTGSEFKISADKFIVVDPSAPTKLFMSFAEGAFALGPEVRFYGASALNNPGIFFEATMFGPGAFLTYFNFEDTNGSTHSYGVNTGSHEIDSDSANANSSPYVVNGRASMISAYTAKETKPTFARDFVFRIQINFMEVTHSGGGTVNPWCAINVGAAQEGGFGQLMLSILLDTTGMWARITEDEVSPSAVDRVTPINLGVNPSATSADYNGTLEIRWDSNSSSVYFNVDGVEVGSFDDIGNLLNGSFAFTRAIQLICDAERESGGTNSRARMSFTHVIYSQG